jgi:predicted small secreted protein
MKNYSSIFTKIFLMAAALSFLNACSTIEGMGKDLQSLGTSIQSSSKKTDTATEGQKAPPSGAVVTPIK